MSAQASDDPLLDELQRASFSYFLRHANSSNGLIADSSDPHSPASIAATGMGVSAYIVGVERGLIARAEALERVLSLLRFLMASEQSDAPEATGAHGLYYHFLDRHNGRRVGKCELSTIDSALLLAGVLSAQAYFDSPDCAAERELRSLADALYQRADWCWAMGGSMMLKHGWAPEAGFLNYGWEGYSEAIILYALGLGSPTYPLHEASYREWTVTFQWENLYGWDSLYAGPLFIHQFSHLWIDFRDIRDEFMREKRCDYFENSRRATALQQRYAIANPNACLGYGEHCWGISAGEGPGFETRRKGTLARRYFGYSARGLPFGPDDGTLAPWAVAAALPFGEAAVMSTLRHMSAVYPEMQSAEGMRSFNPGFVSEDGVQGWIAKDCFGIEQAPVVLMIENHRSGLLWRLMRHCAPIAEGLRRCGFRGGWL